MRRVRTWFNFFEATTVVLVILMFTYALTFTKHFPKCHLFHEPQNFVINWKIHLDLEEKCLVSLNSSNISNKWGGRAGHFLYKKCWETQSCKILRTFSLKWNTRLRTLPFDNHHTSNACIFSHNNANRREFKGSAFTEFTAYIPSCNTVCNCSWRSRDVNTFLRIIKL